MIFAEVKKVFRGVFVLFILLGLFGVVSSFDSEDLKIDVSSNLTILPDSDFLSIIEIKNLAKEDYTVRISLSSPDFGMREERTVIIEGGSTDYFTFRIPGKESLGNNEIFWVFFVNEEMILSQDMNVLVTEEGRAVMFSSDYYNEKIKLIEGVYDNLFVSDAKKNINVAIELAKKGMYFEAVKYLDFTRESLELAVLDEKKGGLSKNAIMKFFDSINWINFALYLSLALIIVGLVIFFKKIFKRIKPLFSRARKVKKNKVDASGGIVENRHPLESFEKEVKTLRNIITHVKNAELKEELLLELKECEEKYQLGLVNLGDAYAKKIRAKLDRRHRF